MDLGYHAVLERDNTVDKGPGVFRLYLHHQLLREWKCITGGDELDSRKYGGLTPELTWVMTQKIGNNEHPKRGTMYMSIIQPVGGGKTFFPNRTLQGEDGYPFMIHVAGISTGCIAIQSSQWDDFVSCINAAFASSSFSIAVVNREGAGG